MNIFPDWQDGERIGVWQRVYGCQTWMMIRITLKFIKNKNSHLILGWGGSNSRTEVTFLVQLPFPSMCKIAPKSCSLFSISKTAPGYQNLTILVELILTDESLSE